MPTKRKPGVELGPIVSQIHARAVTGRLGGRDMMFERDSPSPHALWRRP